VTSAYVVGYPIGEARTRFIAVFQQPTPVPLGGSYSLHLTFRHEYETIPVGTSRHDWEARTFGYIYTVHAPNGAAVLAYHWHPEGNSRVTWPHLHIYGSAQGVALSRVHLPTGDVGPAEIVRCLIADLGAGRDH
jgi:hypothetical protein